VHKLFAWETPRQKNHLEELGLRGKIILKWILEEITWNGVD